MFNNTFYDISENIKINLIDIQELDKNLIDLLDTFFVKICEGDSGRTIDEVKKRLKSHLLKKKGKELEKGMISEFFIHLFLNSKGFKQECTYFNLEEESIKKGFDGYYTFGDKQWIMESKSGSINSQNISHENKILTSYNSLKNQLGGKNKNNPWQNAYSHASQIDVNTEQSIRKYLLSMSSDYFSKKFYKIDNFNIIPTSTIFLNGTWEEQDKIEIKNKILLKMKDFKYKDIIVICVTKKSINMIYDYLNR